MNTEKQLKSFKLDLAYLTTTETWALQEQLDNQRFTSQNKVDDLRFQINQLQKTLKYEETNFDFIMKKLNIITDEIIN